MGYRCGRYRTLASVSVSVRVRDSGWVTGVVGIVPLPLCLCLCVFETVDGLPVW